MPLVYEDLLRDPVTVISGVLRFYGLEDTSLYVELAVQKAIDDLQRDKERSLQQVHRRGGHRHQNEERQSDHTMRMMQQWYEHVVQAAHRCSGQPRLPRR
jgi:Arc/MetJ family transcription regulator